MKKAAKGKRDPDLLDEYDFSKGKRGPVLPPIPGKERITIRLDKDILEFFYDQAGGGNYQTMINNALRSFIERRAPAHA